MAGRSFCSTGSRWKLNNHVFSTIEPFLVCEVFISSESSASTVRDVMFTCRVASLVTCMKAKMDGTTQVFAPLRCCLI